MTDFRSLELKYRSEIEWHIINALPNLYASFIEFRTSDDYEDKTLSYDLIFNLNFTISVRIRNHKYIKYEDMTVRVLTKNGNKSEFDKIKNGMAQVYFYAYEDEFSECLEKVRIVNVESIRKLIDIKNYKIKTNTDGSEFATFNFCDISATGGAIYKYNKVQQLV